MFRYAQTTKEEIRLADQASRKALTLDPDLAQAHASRGFFVSMSEIEEEADEAGKSAALAAERADNEATIAKVQRDRADREAKEALVIHHTSTRKTAQHRRRHGEVRS